MPWSKAARGESMTTSRPPTAIEPESGCTIPARMLISVDLPAPFSPSRLWTSPAWIARSMRSLATTPGYALVMPRNTAAGAEAGGALGGGGGGVWESVMVIWGRRGTQEPGVAPGSRAAGFSAAGALLLEERLDLGLLGGPRGVDLAPGDPALRGLDLPPRRRVER